MSTGIALGAARASQIALRTDPIVQSTSLIKKEILIRQNELMSLKRTNELLKLNQLLRTASPEDIARLNSSIKAKGIKQINKSIRVGTTGNELEIVGLTALGTTIAITFLVIINVLGEIKPKSKN